MPDNKMFPKDVFRIVFRTAFRISCGASRSTGREEAFGAPESVANYSRRSSSGGSGGSSAAASSRTVLESLIHSPLALF